MTWRRGAYRTIQVASWLGALVIALGLLVIVSDYLRDGRVAEAGIDPPYAGLQVLGCVLIWGLPTALWIWVIHWQRTRQWFLGDSSG